VKDVSKLDVSLSKESRAPRWCARVSWHRSRSCCSESMPSASWERGWSARAERHAWTREASVHVSDSCVANAAPWESAMAMLEERRSLLAAEDLSSDRLRTFQCALVEFFFSPLYMFLANQTQSSHKITLGWGRPRLPDATIVTCAGRGASEAIMHAPVFSTRTIRIDRPPQAKKIWGLAPYR